MDFRIADTFTNNLARLNGDERIAVNATAFDIAINPINSGMSRESLIEPYPSD